MIHTTVHVTISNNENLKKKKRKKLIEWMIKKEREGIVVEGRKRLGI